MTIYVKRNVGDFIKGYMVTTSLVTKKHKNQTEILETYGEIRAWFPKLEDALSYAQMLLLNRYYGDYDEIKYLGEGDDE